MSRFALLLLALLLAAPAPLFACPSCADAVPQGTGGGDEDAYNLSRAYNQSILLMLAVPYTMLGVVGFLVYRHLRARASLASSAHSPLSSDSSPGGSSWAQAAAPSSLPGS